MRYYQGYKLDLTKKLKDIKSTLYFFTHLKSNAKLIYLENEDDNKVFSVGFNTLTENNTGIFHILEHSVLCGSKKFMSKEPFNELAKGTLHTYLNAMTFKDKTLYPVASKNDKDFFTLMHVYLDAVFFPLIYERENIFLQEGKKLLINIYLNLCKFD